MYSDIKKAIKQAYFSKIILYITVLTENKNDFLTVGVMLLDNFRVLLLFFFTFWSMGWLSKVLGKHEIQYGGSKMAAFF